MGEINDTDFDIICTTSELAKSLVRRIVVETIDSTWGSPTTSSLTTSSVVGIIIPVNDKDVLELQGNIKIGDAKGFFRTDTTMSNDDIIIDTSDEYRVENLKTMNAGSNNVFKKCKLIRLI